MPTPELNLTDEQICETFPRLVQYDAGNFYDGLGNLITIGGGSTSSGIFRTQVPIGTKNTVNKNFFTSNPFIFGTTKVFVNGLRQTLGVNFDYTETTTTGITFVDAPFPTDNILIEYEADETQTASNHKVNQILLGLKDGTNLVFNTQETFLAGTTKVYRNGLRLTQGIDNDYVETSGNEIRFNRPPFGTDNLLIDFTGF